MKPIILLKMTGVLFFSLLGATISAQVKIGANPGSIDASAVLELEKGNQGLLITRVALTSATDNATIPTPANCLLIYNTASAGIGGDTITPGFYYWDIDRGRWRSLLASTGDAYVVAIGLNAAFANSGPHVNAFGMEAAQNNYGWSVNCLGEGAGRNNQGSLVNSLGSAAGENNEGWSVNALGSQSGQFNTGSEINAMGAMSAQYNTTAAVNAFGRMAARYNTGYGTNALGDEAAKFNNGEHCIAIGNQAMMGDTKSS